MVKHRERFTADLREVWQKFNTLLQEKATSNSGKKIIRKKKSSLPCFTEFQMPLIVKSMIILRRKKKTVGYEKGK